MPEPEGPSRLDALYVASGELLLIQDAELEYEPADWPKWTSFGSANPGKAILVIASPGVGASDVRMVGAARSGLTA